MTSEAGRTTASGHGLTAPAREWRPRVRLYVRSRLVWPLVLLASLLLASLVLRLAHGGQVASSSLFVSLDVAALATLVLLVVLIRQELLFPLSHLRHWARRMQHGNLSARVPTPAGGEFRELAGDINAVGESLERLSRRMREEVQLRTEQVEEKNRALEVLYDVAASVNGSRDVEEILERFLGTVQQLIGARVAMARLADDDGTMRLMATRGLSSASPGCDPEHSGECVCGRVARAGDVEWQPDITVCRQSLGSGIIKTSEPEGTMIAVPLQYQGRTLGLYNLFLDSDLGSRATELENLLTSVGQHIGMAIAKARLEEEARRLSVVEERTRLAHELHDSLAQTLAALRFRLRTLSELLADPDAERGSRKEALERVVMGLEQAHTELRHIIVHFHGPFMEGGLRAAVERLVEEFRAESGAEVHLECRWDGEGLGLEGEREVVRIVHEALCNARKHSGAGTVRILLDTGRLLVEDDGCGMTARPDEVAPGHFGLSSMRERAGRLGGRLEFESSIGEGTRVVVVFPNPEQAPDDASNDVPNEQVQ